VTIDVIVAPVDRVILSDTAIAMEIGDTRFIPHRQTASASRSPWRSSIR
jgi:hypothetical protein